MPDDQKWFSGLEGDLKDNPTLTKFENVGALAKSYVELEKTLGKEKVIIPTDKSTPEEVSAFWRKIGAPEKAEDYDVSDEDVAEPIRISKEAKAALQKKAAELGVPKKHFEELFKTYKGLSQTRLNQEIERIKNLRGESETKLRGEWGTAYEAKVAAAQNVIDTFFKNKPISKEFKDVLVNDQGFISAMAEIAESIGEDKMKGKARTTLTPEEAQSELNSILGDRKGPYYIDTHPEHSAMIDKVLALQQFIEAGKA